MAVTYSGTYKNHRIHTSRLFSGVWVASIVTRRTAGGPAGTEVIHIPGEFRSMEMAAGAAKVFADQALEPKSAAKTPTR
jgi:hypothetical protein